MKIIFTITIYLAMVLYAANSDAGPKALAPKAPDTEAALDYLVLLIMDQAPTDTKTYELDPSELCAVNLKHYLNKSDLRKFKASCKALGL
jgi:hypothetical protein